MYLNVFNSWRYLQKQILKVNAIQYNSTNAHSYKVVMHIQKLYYFCNTSSRDDGPKLGRKYLENNWLRKVYQPIPAKYHKINTAIWKD